MKKLLTILAIVTLVSCTKQFETRECWECTIIKTQEVRRECDGIPKEYFDQYGNSLSFFCKRAN